MTDKTYCFTEQQLANLIRETIGLYEEWQGVHGKSKDIARINTITDTIDGLDSEAELLANGDQSYNVEIPEILKGAK